MLWKPLLVLMQECCRTVRILDFLCGKRLRYILFILASSSPFLLFGLNYHVSWHITHGCLYFKNDPRFSVCFVPGVRNNEKGTHYVPILCFILSIVIAELFIIYAHND
jgi:hypothetical protein